MLENGLHGEDKMTNEARRVAEAKNTVAILFENILRTPIKTLRHKYFVLKMISELCCSNKLVTIYWIVLQ